MQTAEKKATGAQGATAKTTNSPKTENRPSLTGKEAKNEPVQNPPPAEEQEIETAKTNGTATGSPAAMGNQPADAKEQPAAEPVKEPAKPELSLDAKIKAVNDLHRKTIQRLALLSRIKLLEDFEVKLEEENDELESNPYQGCKLIIEDDKRRQFVTNTPNLIRMVSQYIFDACNAKLDEIEGTINFPQA